MSSFGVKDEGQMLIIKEKIPAGAAKVDDFGDQTGPSELAR